MTLLVATVAELAPPQLRFELQVVRDVGTSPLEFLPDCVSSLDEIHLSELVDFALEIVVKLSMFIDGHPYIFHHFLLLALHHSFIKIFRICCRH